jgi:hypothetical protein
VAEDQITVTVAVLAAQHDPEQWSLVTMGLTQLSALD